MDGRGGGGSGLLGGEFLQVVGVEQIFSWWEDSPYTPQKWKSWIINLHIFNLAHRVLVYPPSPPSQNDQYYFEALDKSLHCYISYDTIVLIGDFNSEDHEPMETFLY